VAFSQNPGEAVPTLATDVETIGVRFARTNKRPAHPARGAFLRDQDQNRIFWG
jgi:hypothetical protein